MAQVIPSNYSHQMLPAMGTCKLLQQNNPSNVSFSVQLNANMRSLFYVLLIHALNDLVTVLRSILEMDKCKVYGDANSELPHGRIEQ